MITPRRLYYEGLGIAGFCVLAGIGAVVIRDWISLSALAVCFILCLVGARINYKLIGRLR